MERSAQGQTQVTSSQILQYMLDHMTPRSWFKGSFYASDGRARYCVLGWSLKAKYILLSGRPLSRREQVDHVYLDKNVMNLLQEVINEQYPEHGNMGIENFNDNLAGVLPETTFRDIRLITEKALMKAVEKDL